MTDTPISQNLPENTGLSPNYDARPAGLPIDMLVVHYTGMETARGAIQRLCDPQAAVSAHYLIDEDGTVHRLVDETLRAWHAGVAWWRGSVEINARSIGIELVNPGHEFGYRPFPAAQMGALIELSRQIVSRHDIPARNVVGHSDVAPLRKEDPGELFDWRAFADAGLGLWPGDAEPHVLSETQMRVLLAEYGYMLEDLQMTIAAFQRHFRPSRVDGVMDAQTGGQLLALCNLIAH